MSDEIAKHQADAAEAGSAAPLDARQQRIADAAARALEEAAERRQEAERAAAEPGEKEYGGRNGPEPTRYGDWEKKGIAVDF